MAVNLTATKREDRGKNQARRHRAAGRLPAVVYGPVIGGGKDVAVPVTVDPKSLSKILHSESGQNTIIGLEFEGKTTPVLVKDFLLHPVSHALLHADFYRVAMDRVLQVTIPITHKGEPKGVKQQGGILEFVRREIEIECLPGDIPEHVEIDVSELMLHQGVRVRDIATNPKWTPVSEMDLMLVHVIMPKAEEVAAPAEGAAAVAAAPAEPEVIKKGKKEEGEEEKEDKKK